MDSRNSQASARKYHPTKLVRFETATTTTIFPVAVPGTPQTYKCYVRIWQIMRQGTKILGLLICWSYLPGGTTQHALQIKLVSLVRGTYPVDACIRVHYLVHFLIPACDDWYWDLCSISYDDWGDHHSLTHINNSIIIIMVINLMEQHQPGHVERWDSFVVLEEWKTWWCIETILMGNILHDIHGNTMTIV